VSSDLGIWEEYETVNGESQHTFLILTTSPNKIVEDVHDRMPVILNKNMEKKWLDPYTSEAELLEMMKPYSSEQMMSYTVSPLVNSVQNDIPGVIRRTSPADQYGNYTLFG
jgi:putative SOS response-associated peptidase YedK